MRGVKLVLWLLAVLALAVFASANWGVVEAHIWPGYVAEMPLAVLVMLSFLIGFLPVAIMHRASRWRLRRRLANAEQSLAMQQANTTPITPAASPSPTTPATTESIA